MTNHTARLVLVSGTLLLLTTLGIQPVAALDLAEGFEDDTTLGQPTSADYTFTAASANTFVSVTEPHGGAKSLRYSAQAGVNYGSFQYSGATGCAASGAATNTAVYSAWIHLSALPDAGTEDILGTFLSAGSGSPIFGLKISAAGVITLDGPVGDLVVTGVTMGTGTWTDFIWYASCSASNVSQFACLQSETLEFSVCTTPAVGLSSGTPATNFLNYKQGDATPFSNRIAYLDDLMVVTGATEANAFCADPNVLDYNGVPEADYGYDYRRGGDFFDQSEGDDPNGIGLSTGFDYSGGSNLESQWDYSAKHLTTGSKAMHENITIEADDQSQTTSNFRINFHTQVGSNADVTAKGDGLTTGHFADHVEAEWTESGSTWNIKFHYVNAGGARTQIGGSFNFGDSHDATQFTAWIDTRATANLIGTLDDQFPDNWYQTGDVHADPFIAITSASAGSGPGGERVALIGIRYLDDISGNPFLDDTIGDIWNVASGSIATGTAWHTAIDENDQQNRPNTGDEGDNLDSTCIFDDAGTAVFANSQGAGPQSQLPSLPDDDDDEPGAGECSSALVCTNTANIPEGFTIGTFNALLGMFLIAGISGGAYFTLGRSAVVAGAFALVGLIIAVILGLIQLWVVLVLLVIGAAVVFIGVKRGAGG